jgi:CheY-like chemotaxis protein
VVDDLAENRSVVVDMLSRLGFEMAEAVQGGEGLAQARALRPDLILMDIVMPGMDGLEATRRLRELDDLREVPIIAISASASDADRESSLAAGVNVFLSKPIDLGQFLAHIAVLLQLSWTYAAQDIPSMPEPEAAGPLVVPPQEAMESLHHLARLGKMHDILQQANRLIALDERYRPFAGQLAALAAEYQSQAVLGLVERYLEK